MTADVCQKAIDGFFIKFPKVKEFMAACHKSIITPGYVENAFGRRRYFYITDNQQKMKAQERESGNQPIQGTVADALNIALLNLVNYRRMTGMKYKIILPVHDAIFIDAPADEALLVKNEVLPMCMRDGVPIPNTDLHLGVDTEMMRRWGEHISDEEAIRQAYADLA